MLTMSYTIYATDIIAICKSNLFATDYLFVISQCHEKLVETIFSFVALERIQ